MLKNKGFTLIELMIVVAIIGILAAIAIPKFADLIRKSNEGNTKGNLGTLRSALSIYYGDQEGLYPNDPSALTTNGDYLDQFPTVKTPNYHPNTNAVAYGATGADVNDGGEWIYDNQPSTDLWGRIFVNCTHTDTKGSQWLWY
ncbi:MAG: prepilin-type N-terminal cleavage/methylation domain-containing protein [Elusimicrobiota bacterium]